MTSKLDRQVQNELDELARFTVVKSSSWLFPIRIHSDGQSKGHPVPWCSDCTQVLRKCGISRVIQRPAAAPATTANPAAAKAAAAAADAAAVRSALEICAAIAATSPEGRAVMVELGAVPAAIKALEVDESRYGCSLIVYSCCFAHGINSKATTYLAHELFVLSVLSYDKVATFAQAQLPCQTLVPTLCCALCRPCKPMGAPSGWPSPC